MCVCVCVCVCVRARACVYGHIKSHNTKLSPHKRIHVYVHVPAWACKDTQAQNYICAQPGTSACVCLCLFARAYKDIQAQNYICAQPDTSVCVCACVCARTRIRTYKHRITYVRNQVHLRVCVCLRARARTHRYRITYVRNQIHLCVCVRACV